MVVRKRTPLWRATFGSYLEVASLLLEGGADPRLGDETGQAPPMLAREGRPSLVELFDGWDITKTERLGAALGERQVGVLTGNSVQSNAIQASVVERDV
eukprot:SAG11_NODE_6678_length_1268_cov_0.834046_1_plen_99_part_00